MREIHVAATNRIEAASGKSQQSAQRILASVGYWHLGIP